MEIISIQSVRAGNMFVFKRDYDSGRDPSVYICIGPDKFVELYRCHWEWGKKMGVSLGPIPEKKGQVILIQSLNLSRDGEYRVEL